MRLQTYETLKELKKGVYARSRFGSREMLNLFPAHNARMDRTIVQSPITVHFAATIDEPKYLDAYLRYSDDIDTPIDGESYHQMTSLQLAYECQSQRMLDALLEAGAHIGHNLENSPSIFQRLCDSDHLGKCVDFCSNAQKCPTLCSQTWHFPCAAVALPYSTKNL